MAALSFFMSALLSATTATASLIVTVTDAGTVRSVPPGTQRVEMLSLQFAASCDADVPLRGITLRHRGLGDSSDIESVYLLSGGYRVTDGRSIASRDGRVQLSLRDVVVPACGTLTLDVAADYAQDAAVAGEHRFIVSSPSDIDALDATVNIRRMTSQATTVPIGSPRGRIDVAYLQLHRNPLYGSDRTLARLQLTADGQSDQSIASITLTNDGSARDTDLRNLSLQSSGGRTLTNTAVSLNGDLLHLTFDPPLRLGKNSTRLLELHGDVRASRRRTIRFVVKEPSDIIAEPAQRTRR